MKDRINQEIQRTMDSLDGMKSADPGPYFFRRLEAKASDQRTVTLSPVWKMAMAVLVLINVFSFIILGSFQEEGDSDPVESLSQGYFGTSSDSFYDLALNETNNEE